MVDLNDLNEAIADLADRCKNGADAESLLQEVAKDWDVPTRALRVRTEKQLGQSLEEAARRIVEKRDLLAEARQIAEKEYSKFSASEASRSLVGREIVVCGEKMVFVVFVAGRPQWCGLAVRVADGSVRRLNRAASNAAAAQMM